MAEFITGFETADGVKKYDYNSLANKPEDGTGTIISGNADYAEVGEWSDGNPGSEDRLGYFVAIAAVGDNTIKIRKATSEDDVKGVTVLNPAFSGNAAAEKYVSDGVLYPKYSYVGLMGIVSVIDNGTCTVGGRCMPANDGTAIPSTNNMGYGVLERIDKNHVLIAVEPGADMIQRIKTQIVELQNRPSGGEEGTDGLSILYLNSSLVGSVESYHFSNFTLLNGRIPKVNDLVLFADGNVGYIHSVKPSEEIATVAHIAGTTFKGDKGDKGENGVSPSVNVSKTGKVTTIKITDANGTKTATINDGADGASGSGGGDPGGPIDPTRIPDMYYTEERQDVEILPPSPAIDTGSAMMGELYVIGSPITLVVGKTYKVIYNGAEYESVASEFTLPQIGLSVGLGDVGIVTTGTPSGAYPFVLAINDLLVQMGACAAVIPLDGSSNITVSIVGYGEKIHHLPSKYIKDMYYEEVFEEKEILPEMTLTSTDFTVEGTSFTLKPNYPYKVIYGGTSYSCISKTYVADSGSLVYLGYSYLLGGENTGEPFGILSINGTTLFSNKDANVTISIIEGGEFIHKIDKKYISAADNAVPPTRKINNKELSSDITLTASDVSAVPATRTVNGKALSSNISLSASDVSAVPTSRRVNGWPLSSDITLSSEAINGVAGTEYEINGENVVAQGGAEVFNGKSNNKAVGICSHAEGNKTTASGTISHAEGSWTIASGTVSHAEGSHTTASADASHAEGSYTIASGSFSHAEGAVATASGTASHAEGSYTIASGDYSHVQGKSNIEDTENKYAHIVGNGSSPNARRNAHTLDWSGNAWYAGSVECTAVIINSSTAGSTKKFKITVTDNGTITATEV